jgi:flagellar hook-basal body complex protein FliE
VRSATSSVTGGNLSKNSLQAAATSLSSANDKLQSDLKAQGTPNTSAGKAAKQSIDKLSTTVKDGADSIKSAVSDSSGIAGLRAAATAIGSALASMKNQFTATYDSLRGAKGDLHDAFQNAPACQQLSASSHSS